MFRIFVGKSAPSQNSLTKFTFVHPALYKTEEEFLSKALKLPAGLAVETVGGSNIFTFQNLMNIHFA